MDKRTTEGDVITVRLLHAYDAVHVGYCYAMLYNVAGGKRTTEGDAADQN